MSAAEPRRLRAVSGEPEEALVAAAAEVLAAGDLLVLPTDTVYGLACRADDERAIARLFAAKRRPRTRPLPLLLPSAEALAAVAAGPNEAAARLGAAFWPGALTIVVRKAPAVSDSVTAGRGTVGVRVPDCPLARAVLARCPFPVAASSANLADEDPACEVTDLPGALLAAVALVLDAGPRPGAIDQYGRVRGWAASALVHYGGAYKGGCWLLSGVAEPAFYRTPAFLQTLVGFLRAVKERNLPRECSDRNEAMKAKPVTLQTPPPGGLRLVEGHFVRPDGRRFFIIGTDYIGSLDRKFLGGPWLQWIDRVAVELVPAWGVVAHVV